MKIKQKELICSMLDSGMNNKRLSEISGVSLARISNIKNGDNTTYETACKIAKALNIPVLSLIDDTE
jgi:transcriptional regulator with XRE-family HTH domain